MDLYVTVLICVFLFIYIIILVIVLCLRSHLPVSVLQFSAVLYIDQRYSYQAKTVDLQINQSKAKTKKLQSNGMQ